MRRAEDVQSGIWTIVFTDLVGSTAQRSRLGDVVGDGLRREHDAIVERAVSRHDGVVVKGTGDGAMCAFGSAVGALDAAAMIVRSIDRFNIAAGEPLLIRVGVSLGELVFENDDLHGLPANEAARLCAAAQDGEVLVADIVRTVVASRSNATFVDRGRLELKGLDGARQVWCLEVARDVELVVPEVPAVLASVGSLAFSGRAAELARLETMWNAARGGTTQIAFVSGEAGIGKTRLASELARIAHDDEALVLYGRCDADFAMPFQPFVEALDWYCAHAPDGQFTLGPFPAELARVAPTANARLGTVVVPPSSDPEVERYRLFEAVTTWLRAVAQDLPVLFVLDDLHWATGPTLSMLQHALRSSDLGALLVVGTYRNTDVDRRHPLLEVRVNLERLIEIDHIELPGLDESQVSELLSVTAGQPIDEQMSKLARVLADQTSGNPFFVGQVLRHLTEQGRLNQRDDGWHLEGPVDDLGLPPAVQTLVQHRVGRLSDAAIDTLHAAAAIGREFDLDLLITVAGLREEDVFDAVESAARARLVDELNDERYRFVHALVRHALLDEISAARLSRLHCRIAEALERRHDEEPSIVAYHWVEAGSAGDEGRRIAALVAAGERAMTRSAFIEAAEYFDRALEELRADTNGDVTAICELLIHTGEAHAASGDYDHARTCYVECGALGADNEHDEWVVAAGLRLSGPNAYRSTVTDAERALVALAYAHCPEGDFAGRSILAARYAALFDERSNERQQWTSTAVSLALRSGQDDPRRAALSQQVLRAFFPEALDGQLTATAEIVDLARRSGGIEAVLEALMLQCIPLGIAARWDEFETARAEVECEAERYGHTYYQAAATLARAARLSCLGRLDDAESLSSAAIAIYDGEEIAMPWIALLIQIRDFQGRLDELKAAVSERRVERDTMPALLFTLARAMIVVLTGAPEEAREVLRGAAADEFELLSPEGARQRSFELAMFTHVAALVHESALAGPLHKLLAPYDGQQVVGTPGIHLGPVALYLGMLERLLRRNEDARRHFETVIITSDRHGELSYGGIARAELIHLLETTDLGDQDRAQRLRNQLRSLVADHGLGGATRHLEVIENSLRH